ncbi:MAG: orotidine-5'-phosphate decarboxylase [Candidatus Riflebacteria bacterium]|nr:orotidine-5'-phosphate decarboxylase [Candidatus Riflebacteria bacterium]
MNFADRLMAVIDKVGTPLCAGLDPVLERLPSPIVDRAFARRSGPRAAADALGQFCLRVMDALEGMVPAVKLQSACFELYGRHGVAVLEKLVREARRRGFLVLGDVKRGDIGATAEHYASAYLGGPETAPGRCTAGFGMDAITVNPYLGPEAVQPFVRACERFGAGIFVVVLSSNPGAELFQRGPGRALFERVAVEVDRWGADLVGQCGYSSIGAVVGATRATEAAGLRRLMPRTPFLLPGVGAQGGEIESLAPVFDRDGRGGLVTVSRSLIYAHESRPGVRMEAAVRQVARRLVDQLDSVREQRRGKRSGSKPAARGRAR